MENRRQHFRYDFTPQFYWRAAFRALDGGSTFSADITNLTANFSADIVNLSVGGVCVRFDPGTAVVGDRWIVSIALTTQAAPLQIPVERVHARGKDPNVCGFRFLPLPSAAEQDVQDRLIWRFLLEAQRRNRRQSNWSQESE